MVHGGDIYRNQVELDFSVNINPLGIPAGIKEALRTAVKDCIRYPDLRSEELKKKLEESTGIDRMDILCGSGASELFLAIMHAVRPDRTIIPVPSFWGYEHAARAAECRICHVQMRPEDGFCLREELLWQKLRQESFGQENGLRGEHFREVLFLANPNNPVGNLLSRERLAHILTECRKRNIIAVVDECFIEFTGKEETHSLKTLIKKYPNLIVVRAFTKIYAIPGVRLGYLFCGNRELLGAIEKQLPEWNLSVFAQAAGIAACREIHYKNQTAEYVKRERTYLTGELKRAGINVYPSEAGYLLLYTECPLYVALLEKKILIRDCSNFRGLHTGFYRIAVKTHEENKQLIQAVNDIRNGGYHERNLKRDRDCAPG